MILSAFADEISPDLGEQVAVLQEQGIRFLDLRSVGNVNVLDLDDARIAEIHAELRRAGIGVAAIASPLGKVPLDTEWTEQVRRLERALQLADVFESRFVRIFSFYPPVGAPGVEYTWTVAHRHELVTRIRAMTVRARSRGITLLHENEKDIYGDSIERCVDLLTVIDDPYFAAAFDPANFIQCAQEPYPAAYDALHPWIRYVHVKDARPDGTVVPVGVGEARWPQLLRRLHQDGYDGFLSLEPHLASAGRFQGFSGPDLFREACRAMRAQLEQI